MKMVSHSVRVAGVAMAVVAMVMAVEKVVRPVVVWGCMLKPE